jgi:hypothetical protein
VAALVDEAKQFNHEEFEAWLREAAGAMGPRRLAHAGRRTILVSKFEEGFFERLEAALQRLPALFDEQAVTVAYRTAAGMGRAASRAEAWRLAMESILRRAEASGTVDARQRAEVMAGVDSVAALLGAVTWTDPGPGSPWTPTPAETSAIAELRARLAPDGDLFTRHYGAFEGVPVVNQCPGSRYARRFLEMALQVTGMLAGEAAAGTSPSP